MQRLGPFAPQAKHDSDRLSLNHFDCHDNYPWPKLRNAKVRCVEEMPACVIPQCLEFFFETYAVVREHCVKKTTNLVKFVPSMTFNVDAQGDDAPDGLPLPMNADDVALLTPDWQALSAPG